MAPLVQNDNELSSKFNLVAIIVFVAFAVICSLSIILVLIMCCSGEKKKEKEAASTSVKEKTTRFEVETEQKSAAVAEKPKEVSEHRNVKLKKDVSFKAKDSSQISRMGSFQMQSNQLQEKKGGRSQSFAKGPAGAYDGSKIEQQSLNLMTTRDADEKKPVRSLIMKYAGEKKVVKQLTQNEKKVEKSERKANKRIKERKNVKGIKKTEVKNVKEPEVKTAKKDTRIPKHLRPESTHYNIPMNMDM